MKRYIGGMVAIVIALSASAFMNKPVQAGSPQWFLYNDTHGGGEGNYQNYTAGTPGCTTGSQLCAVFTSTDAQGRPIVPVNDPQNRRLFK